MAYKLIYNLLINYIRSHVRICAVMLKPFVYLSNSVHAQYSPQTEQRDTFAILAYVTYAQVFFNYILIAQVL